MTNEEAIAIIDQEYLCVDRDCDIERSCGKCDLAMPSKEPILEAYKMAKKALNQEPILDVIAEKISNITDTIVTNPEEIFKRKTYVRYSEVIKIIDECRKEQE